MEATQGEKLSYSFRKGSVPVTNTTLYKVFEEARENGANTVFYFMATEERVYLKDVWNKVDEYAKGMLAIGLKRGDTMASMALLSVEALYLSVAAVSIGVGYSQPYVYEPVDQSIPNLIELIDANLLVVGEGNGGEAVDFICHKLNQDTQRYPNLKQILYDNTFKARLQTHQSIRPTSDLIKLGETITDEHLLQARQAVKPEDPVMHLFSSGSTGKPKCIVHTQYGMSNELLCQVPKTGLGNLMVTSNNQDELCSHAGIAIGVAGYADLIVLGPEMFSTSHDNNGQDMRRMADVVNTESIHHLVVTSGYISYFLRMAREEDFTFPSVKTVLLAGQLFSEQFKQDILKYIGAIPWTMYGQSEVMNISLTSLADTAEARKQRMAASMLPMYNTEVKLVDEDEQTVPLGHQGQVLVKKYSILMGYLISAIDPFFFGDGEMAQSPPAPSGVYLSSKYKNLDPQVMQQMQTQDGFVKTGDIGVMDINGAITLHGRHVDALRFKVFAEVLYTGPIETALCELPAIREAQVISVSWTDFHGDELVYCLCLENGHTKPSEEQLTNHIINKLDEMKIACRIVYFDQFPRTANSRKVSKAKIKEKVKQLIKDNSEYGITKWFADFKEAVQGTTNIAD